MAKLEDIRFVVDENTLALGKAIAGLRNDTAVVGRDPVAELLPLRTRPHEAGLAVKHGLMCINLRSAGNLNRWMQLVRLVSSWDAAEEYVRANPCGPWWLSLTKNGMRPLSYRSDETGR